MQPALITNPHFTPLHNLHLCTFALQYSELPNGQFEFLRLSNNVQRCNLMLVDSAFPEILAAAALYVCKSRPCTPEQVIQNLATQSHYDREFAPLFYRTKFYRLFEMVFFSNISSSAVCKGEIDNTKVYCLKNASGVLEYYSLNEAFGLYELAEKNAICSVTPKSIVRGEKTLEFSMRLNLQLI